MLYVFLLITMIIQDSSIEITIKKDLKIILRLIYFKEVFLLCIMVLSRDMQVVTILKTESNYGLILILIMNCINLFLNLLSIEKYLILGKVNM